DADDGPRRRLPRLDGVLKPAVADHLHPHAGGARRRPFVKMPLQGRRGLSDHAVELEQFRLSLRVEVEIGAQTIDVDAKHAGLVWLALHRKPNLGVAKAGFGIEFLAVVLDESRLAVVAIELAARAPQPSPRNRNRFVQARDVTRVLEYGVNLWSKRD